MVSVFAINLYTMVISLFQRIPSLSLTAVKEFAADQSAQDIFEYLLVIGGVSVAVILAIATPVGKTMSSAIVSGVCTAIATIPGLSSVSC